MEILKPDYWYWVYGGDLGLVILAIYFMGKGISGFKEDNKRDVLILKRLPLPSDTHGNAFFHFVLGTLFSIMLIVAITNEFIKMYQYHMWGCIGLIPFAIFSGSLFAWWRFFRER
jgi:hypothetical protein